MRELQEIIERITERYEAPVRVGSRCEAQVFYRMEYLTSEDMDTLAEYVSERIEKVCSPMMPEVLISLPGSYTSLARYLSRTLSSSSEPIEVVNVEQLTSTTATQNKNWLRGMNVCLVNDVITTARSCLDVHTKATVLGASVLCWAAVIDRTFGPGPVPVVAACTGDPVRLLDMA